MKKNDVMIAVQFLMLIGGCASLSMEFGVSASLGIGMIVFFLKNLED